MTLNGCTVIAIAGVAASTTVSLGTAVVGTVYDVTKAGVGVVTSSSSK